jgi:hypothetical protein
MLRRLTAYRPGFGGAATGPAGRTNARVGAELTGRAASASPWARRPRRIHQLDAAAIFRENAAVALLAQQTGIVRDGFGTKRPTPRIEHERHTRVSDPRA